MNIEEAGKEIEKIKEMFIYLKNHGWINDIKKEIDVNKAIESIATLLTAYEKEKEKNKESEEKIRKYINKIQKELDKYKIKNTNTYIQIEGNPEIDVLLIQKATLEELIEEE